MDRYIHTQYTGRINDAIGALCRGRRISEGFAFPDEATRALAGYCLDAPDRLLTGSHTPADSNSGDVFADYHFRRSY